MEKTTFKVIGLMSGSSLDGLDIVYCEYKVQDNGKISCDLIHAENVDFSARWRSRLKHLPKQDALTFSKTNTYFGHYMGQVVNHFIGKHEIEPDFIASHGHTIFHYPDDRVTVQIGDGGALAAITGYPVVCDFRTHDIAIDGEGTPIAPIADKVIFGGYDFYLNIGGIANISCDIGDKIVAFDICAANQVMNSLAHKVGKAYDKDGQMASEGEVSYDILEALDGFDYFKKDYPKSLDNQWIRKNITPIFFQQESSFEDKFRTAAEHIAIQLIESIHHIVDKEGLKKTSYTLFATGGGALNIFLMERIEEILQEIEEFEVKLIIPESNIIEYKEAMLMGLMGVLRVLNKPNCLSSVTGAIRDTIGGAIYQGSKSLINN